MTDLSADIPRLKADVRTLDGRVDNLDMAVFGDPKHQVTGLVELRADTQRIIRTVDATTRALKWLTVTVATVGPGIIIALVAGG